MRVTNVIDLNSLCLYEWCVYFEKEEYEVIYLSKNNNENFNKFRRKLRINVYPTKVKSTLIIIEISIKYLSFSKF